MRPACGMRAAMPAASSCGGALRGPATLTSGRTGARRQRQLQAVRLEVLDRQPRPACRARAPAAAAGSALPARRCAAPRAPASSQRVERRRRRAAARDRPAPGRATAGRAAARRRRCRRSAAPCASAPDSRHRRDEQHRPLLGDALHRRLEQPGAEAGVVGAQAGRRRLRGGRDVPVTGRRVVDRIGEAGRRDQPVGAGQHLAQRMAVAAVAGRRTEHRRKRRRIERRRVAGLLGDRDRQLDDLAGAAPLGRRQPLRRRQHGRLRPPPTGRIGERGARGRPSLPNPGPTSPTERSCSRNASDARHAAAPSSRQALVPPKPKELLATTRSRAGRGSVDVVAAQLRIGRDPVGAGRNRLVLQRQHRDRRLDRAGGAQRVAGRALGRTARQPARRTPAAPPGPRRCRWSASRCRAG